LKKLSLLIVFLYSSLLYAQLQDSHFYKVSADEVSSDFTLDSHWKTHVEGSILKNIEGRERLMKIKLYGKFNLKFNSYLSGEFEPYLVIKEDEKVENDPHLGVGTLASAVRMYTNVKERKK